MKNLNRHYFDLLLVMTEKEIKARYKKAFFGFLWMFLNPVFQMVVIGFVFQSVRGISIDNFFLYLIAGLLPWNFFSFTILKNTPLIVYERRLLQKAQFQREIPVIAMTLANMLHFLIALLLVILYSITRGAVGGNSIFLLIVAFLWLFALTAGVSLLFSALNVRFRDINFFAQAIIPLWFYATPIIYTIQIIPERFHTWIYLNPLTAVIDLFHLALMPHFELTTPYLWISVFSSFVIVSLGVWIFSKESPYFVDWL